MVTFSLYSKTTFGQNMYVKVGGNDYPMVYNNDYQWIAQVDIKTKQVVKYQYFLKDVNGKLIFDSPKVRYVPKTDIETLFVNDIFGSKRINSVFETKPFNVLMVHNYNKKDFQLPQNKVLLIVYVAGVESYEGVAISGSSSLFGQWKEENILKLSPLANGVWYIAVDADIYLSHSEYKVVKYNKLDGNIVEWESGENRRMPLLLSGNVVSVNVDFSINWHAKGVAIPLFSLRSKNDWGVGEFYDLLKLGKWALKHNLSVIQILPINDTTATHTALDSYPYRANSVFALHPMYINIDKVGRIEDEKLDEQFRQKAAQLNKLDKVDYVAVNELKTAYLTALYEQRFNSLEKNIDYQKFVEQNRYWLDDYALFRVLAQRYKTDITSLWPLLSVYDKELAEKELQKEAYNVGFYYFVQYHLQKQLLEVVQKLHKMGVVLKGDLPIGVGEHSVDVWVNPLIFNRDMQVGAPPDDFSEDGQNWGFPTYNWTQMAKDGYKWWSERFAVMEKYFDLFRVDHILGFFRIWEIPLSAKSGLLGHFNPAKPFSISEINQYGIAFDYNRYATPYITKELLVSLFGENCEKIISHFLVSKKNSTFAFVQKYSSQADLERAYCANELIDISLDEYNKLLTLYTNLLFIEDKEQKGYYHPRINLHKSHSFASLPWNEQYALKSLHDEFFYYRHNNMWYDVAAEKLTTLVNVTQMLVCGEDLGMVPSCVPPLMKELNILSLEVERMPKQLGAQYVDLQAVPYLSVCCTGTHDTSPLRLWWQENRAQSEWYYYNILSLSGNVPEQMTQSVASKICENHFLSKSMFAILPWQDLVLAYGEKHKQSAEDERINVPANPKHIWCWRMPITLK